MTDETAAPLDHRHSAILHRACRRTAPDIWLAVRFLSRDARDQLLATAAVLRLLSDVVAGREVERDPGAEPDEPEAPGGGGCGCGSGLLVQRTAVAHNIVSFLFEDVQAASVGRPELEAFVVVRRTCPLPREAFDAFIEGCSAAAEVRRIATLRSRQTLISGIAQPLAEIITSIVLPGPRSAERCSDLASGISALIQARELLTIRRSINEQDRCLVSLEALSRFSLRDSDLARWLRGSTGAPDPELDHRCTRLLEYRRRQCLGELVHAAPLLESLPGGAARACAAVAGVWGAALAGEPLGAAEPARSLPERLKAYRFRAWRHAIARRLDPRLVAASSQGSVEPPTAELPMTPSGSVSHR